MFKISISKPESSARHGRFVFFEKYFDLIIELASNDLPFSLGLLILKFELLSDEKTIVLKKYKAWGLKKFLGKEYYGIIRTTVLINEKGKIVKTWSNVRVKDHVKNVINELSNI